ncbi:transglutaminase family protein [Terrihabitans sp. B22-R8]|uniref:transglutaminase family protein n=1 Tax=Terrihabitans sp. B22-R8 TaxID=3425128 RepID=UPI00403C9E6B
MPELTVRHVTTYRYARPVGFGDHRMMVRPLESYDQRLIDMQIDIQPRPVDLRWIHDAFGNCVAIARFGVDSDVLRFESNVRLEHLPQNVPDFRMESYARTYPFTYGAEEMPDLVRCIERAYFDPNHEVAHWVHQFLDPRGETPTGELLMTITHAIKESFTYIHRYESGTQDPLTTLHTGRGTCRDFAVLMMEAVRALGLASRFVSGYLYVPSASGRVGGGNTHAWCQVYLPGAGWVEFDPTNGIIGNRDLIRVAVVRDPRQAIPLHGTWIGSQADSIGMSVEVDVREVQPSLPLEVV